MIRLNCNNCKAQLSIDDAFAGGVCRCQYCGTIQTVPKHLKTAADSSGSVSLKTPAKPSAAKKSRTDPGGSSGLDALANAVAGSGLSGSAVGRPTPAQKARSTSGTSLQPAPPSLPAATVPRPTPVYTPPAPKAGLPLALIIIAVVILLLLGIVVGLLLKNHGGG
jgi:hypothetical protein